MQNNFPQKTTARVLINKQDSVSFIGNKKLFKKFHTDLNQNIAELFISLQNNA